jgi:HPt (histidine-containing phosphotransfer) domain-containing protein
VAETCDGAVPADGVAASRVDARVVSRLVDDLGPDHAAEVCAVFLGDAAETVRAVDAARASGDADAAARLAHRLKSASGFVGAAGVSGLCAEIERLARDGRLVEVGPRIDLLVGELGRVSTELSALTI